MGHSHAAEGQLVRVPCGSKFLALALPPLLAGVLVCCPTVGQADDSWPQWRGANGTGYAGEVHPPTTWSDEENVQWKCPLPGRGHSTPIVTDTLVFLTAALPTGEKLTPKMSGRPGAHDNLPVDREYKFIVIAIDRKTGDVRWQTTVKQAIPREGAHRSASLASASPVADDSHVYAFFGSQGLYCLDFDGNQIWSRDFGQMHSKHGHGEGASPALHGNTLVINWDQEEQSFVTALDKDTGETLWRNERDEVTSWSTPIIVEHSGAAQLIVAGTGRVRSYDLTSGGELWQCGGMSANIVATPVYSDGVLIVGSSYEKKVMLAIDLEKARGDVTGTDAVLWSRTRATPYVPSMLLVDDGVYFLAHYQNILTRLNFKTGAESPGPMRLGPLTSIYASPVAAGDHIYVTDLLGTTMVVTKGPVPKPVAINQLNEKVNASLAIAGQQIFIRTEQHLYCIAD